jgi:arylsulfatase A-like enzyme
VRARHAAALLVALLAGACGRTPQRSVLLVTVDTLRPDALGWVAGRNATPAIDALAAAGFRFPGAVSPVPLTLPAHTSLLTGLDPHRHGVRDNGQLLGPAPTTLGGILGGRGYATGAFVSGYPLRALFGLDRGFERYDDDIGSAGDIWLDRPAEATTDAALAWLRDVLAAAPQRPWFLWVHYFEPHDPYTPPPRFARPGPRGAYDGEVAAADAAVGRLLSGVGSATAGTSRLTVFAGDHGESLGEHGEDTHGIFVYDSTVLVPLIIAGEGLVRPGESRAPARLVDVLPTLLDLLEIPPCQGLDGISLRPLLDGGMLDPPAAYLESQQPWLGYGWAPLVGLRTSSFKLIDAPQPELYDLARDPGETANRLASDAGTAGDLGRTLRARQAQGAAPAAPADDPEVLAALRSLGYASGFGAGRAPSGPDPKDRIAELRLISLAEAEARAGSRTSALAILDMVLETEPDQPYANLRAGTLLAAEGQLAEAIERLEHVLRIEPTHPEAAFALADALSRAGRLDRAEAAWRLTVRIQPRRAVAWSNLGTVLLRRSRVGEAIGAMAKAVDLAPADPVLVANLAEARYQHALLLQAAGRTEEARATLLAAAAAAPALRQRAAMDPRLVRLLVNP